MADDEILAALRGLANRWTLKARDFARQAKDPGENEAQAAYNRGYAEGYYKAATELAQVIKEQEIAGPLLAPTPAAVPTPPTPQATPAPGGRRPLAAAPPTQPLPPKQQPVAPTIYAYVSVGEALAILTYAGVAARDVLQNKDNSFHAIFSRWENVMPHERIEKIRGADPRIVVLANGKLETHDHFVDFAFKDS